MITYYIALKDVVGERNYYKIYPKMHLLNPNQAFFV